MLRSSVRPALYFLGLGTIYCDYQDIRSKFTLLGEGIRQVTFLYINAYEIKLYLTQDSIQRIKNTSRWNQEYTIERFLKPIEQNWFARDLVKSDLAIEIIPSRPTDGAHLRNGFIRMMNQRLGTASDPEKDDYAEGLSQFRAIIPNKSVPKGASLLFSKEKDHFRVYYDGKQLGKVQSPTLSTWFFEQYITNQAAPSFTSSIAKGLDLLFSK